jgi:hypothetical protein
MALAAMPMDIEGYADAYATLSNGQSTSGNVTAKAGAETLTSGARLSDNP